MNLHCKKCEAKIEKPSNRRHLCNKCRMESLRESKRKYKKQIRNYSYEYEYEYRGNKEEMKELRLKSPWYDSDPERTPF